MNKNSHIKLEWKTKTSETKGLNKLKKVYAPKKPLDLENLKKQMKSAKSKRAHQSLEDRSLYLIYRYYVSTFIHDSSKEFGRLRILAESEEVSFKENAHPIKILLKALCEFDEKKAYKTTNALRYATTQSKKPMELINFFSMNGGVSGCSRHFSSKKGLNKNPPIQYKLKMDIEVRNQLKNCDTTRFRGEFIIEKETITLKHIKAIESKDS